MRKHINIPIFIPHLGCPNQCVFCNQRSISGVEEFKADSVVSIIDDALLTIGDDVDVEIAFFGGSFTGIDRELMVQLLSIAKGYIDRGAIRSVRCSTRPDYIDDEVLTILKSYGVSSIELGLQSRSQRVLDICKRGHTSQDEEYACKKITEYGFCLGGQMMIGLPGATVEDEIETARFIVDSGASEARIYPTVVFKNTELCDMCADGRYSSLSIEESVCRAAEVFEILYNGGVKILRIGLCDSENLHSESSYFAGPNHPALGELVENRVYLNRIRAELSKIKETNKCDVTIHVPRGHVSKVIGQKQINKKTLINEFGLSSLKVSENPSLIGYNILLEIQERK